MLNRFTKNNERGQVTLIAVLVLGIILTTVVIGIGTVSVNNLESSEDSLSATNAYFLAETGIEDALFRLTRDINYTGGLYTTTDGTYDITITEVGDDYGIESIGTSGKSERRIKAELTLQQANAGVAEYAVYSGDDVFMFWGDSEIHGDIWAEDDIDFTSNSSLYGDVFTRGDGGFFFSWVNWGANILDNPATVGVTEGNLWSYNSAKIWGGHVENDVHSNNNIYVIFGGTVGGTQYEDEDFTLEPLPVPFFDFDFMKDKAVSEGTYYSNVNQFITYAESFDDGDTITLPDGHYYIKSGNLVEFDIGSPIVLNGGIITEGTLRFWGGLQITGTQDLPALAAKKDIEIRDFGWPKYGGDTVTIDGIVFAERDIVLKHDDSDKDITITGAAWGGDDLRVEQNSVVYYDEDLANNILNFDFSSSEEYLEINSWYEY